MSTNIPDCLKTALPVSRRIPPLPFDEPLLVKTSACLIAIETNGCPDARLLRLQFSEGLDDWQKELIHVYVLKKQFELIRQRKGWYASYKEDHAVKG